METLIASELRRAIPSYVFSLPSSIISFLLEDDVFVKDLKLPWTSTLTVNNAPVIESRRLLDSVRQAFTKGVPVVLTNDDGENVKLVPSEKEIGIRYQDEAGKERDAKAKIFSLIHPKKSIRLETLESLINAYGPTHPEEAFWRSIVNDRPLTDTELWKYIKSVENSLGPTLKRIENQLFLLTEKTQTNKPPDFLVPDAPEYFENLCGPPRDAMPREDYLSQVTISRLQSALGYGLVQG